MRWQSPRRAEACADPCASKRASRYSVEQQPRSLGNLWDSLWLPQQPSWWDDVWWIQFLGRSLAAPPWPWDRTSSAVWANGAGTGTSSTGQSFPGTRAPDLSLSAAFGARIYRKGKAFCQPWAGTAGVSKPPGGFHTWKVIAEITSSSSKPYADSNTSGYFASQSLSW